MLIAGKTLNVTHISTWTKMYFLTPNVSGRGLVEYDWFPISHNLCWLGTFLITKIYPRDAYVPTYILDRLTKIHRIHHQTKNDVHGLRPEEYK